VLAVLRFDVSPSIGAGHGSRSRALGSALARYGWQTVVACRALSGGEPNTIELAGPPEQEPAALAARLPQGCDLLLVDHYGRDREFERACRPWARRILAIDDLAGRDHDAEILLDPTPGRRRADIRLPGDAATQAFLGADFAPLREAFLRHRHAGAAPAPGSIFVGFGGTDPTGLTRRTLNVLRSQSPPGPIVAVLGRHAQAGAELRAEFGNDRSVRIVIDPPDMAAAMAECEMAIGAGGVSSLERCVLGLPSIAIVVADNQRETVNALAAGGAVVAVEDPADETFGDVLSVALHDLRERRRSIALAAQAVCDGLGAARVAAAVVGPALRDGSRVAFRPVTADDSDALFHWQGLPEIRRYSHSPGPPSRSAHADWLTRKLSDPTRVFDVAHRGGEPVGVIRLDREAAGQAVHYAGQAVHYKVSIYVLPQCQSMGVGRAMLAFARRAVPWATLVAEVLPGNAASQRLFLTCGFRGGNGAYVQDPMKEAA
jgi:UDP-2,4-diacetamido-2,4,6-trideoxy-beta-L-altropyranose hydrolase